jgi:hypothetical protein
MTIAVMRRVIKIAETIVFMVEGNRSQLRIGQPSTKIIAWYRLFIP